MDADWTRGVEETVAWVERNAPDDALLFVDAPLVVHNESGQRLCEKQVDQRYGRAKVSANSTNIRSKWLGGVALRKRLETFGWRYSDGCKGPPRTGRHLKSAGAKRSQNKPKDDQAQSSRVPRATGRWMHQKQKTSGDHAS